VHRKGVKKHVFLPSNTEIWTVVGHEGEYFVSKDLQACTCPAFYFALIRGKKKPCYHVLSLKIAIKTGNYSITIGHDDEIQTFLTLLTGMAPPRQTD